MTQIDPNRRQDPEYFRDLAANIEQCHYFANAADGDEAKAASERLGELEREMDHCPFEFDEDGNVVATMTHQTIPLPRALTAENGAKAVLSGEFYIKVETDCAACFENGPDIGCEVCQGYGSYMRDVMVPWTTIKAIWRRAVEHFEKQGS